jgi:DNA polymerase
MSVTRERGRVLGIGGRPMLVTVHPAYLLRIPETARAEAEYEHFVEDLRLVRPWMEAAEEPLPMAV